MNTEVKNIVTENRIGKFKVSKKLFEDASEELFLLFSKILISRCELINPHVYEYCGYSEMFGLAEKGAQIPEYRIECFKKDPGGITLNAKKLDTV